MKLRNLMVLAIAVFMLSALSTAEDSSEVKVEWEFTAERLKGQATAIVTGATYNEVWRTSMDVLLFEKFKPRGSALRVVHEVVEVEKDAGLIAVTGVMGGYRKYVFRVTIQEKDGQIVMKLRCTSKWKKRVIEKFFQLLEEGLEAERTNADTASTLII